MAAIALAACRSDGTELVEHLHSSPRTGPDPTLHKVVGPQCGELPASPHGHVYFRLGERANSIGAGRVFRVEAVSGAVFQDVSAAMDVFGPGADVFISASPNGKWILLGTTRFGCGEQTCMAVVTPDLCSANVVFSGASAVSPESTSVISSDGNLIVYPGLGGPHGRDLFAIRRAGEAWSKPVLLTASSPYAFHRQPYLSADGTRVTMDCSPLASAGPSSAICEATTDGTAFKVTVTPDIVPPGSPPHDPANQLTESAYEANGGIVFEGAYNANSEQIWRLPPGATVPVLVNTDKDSDSNYIYTDDNGPCVLPDGRIASLWLGRPGAGKGSKESGHEIKVMNPDGSGGEMIVFDRNIDDIGIFCTE
jgi:hypothetical protein